MWRIYHFMMTLIAIGDVIALKTLFCQSFVRFHFEWQAILHLHVCILNRKCLFDEGDRTFATHSINSCCLRKVLMSSPGHSTTGVWGWLRFDALDNRQAQGIRGRNLGQSMTLDPDRSSSPGPFSRGMTRPKLVFHVSIICRLCRDRHVRQEVRGR